MQPHANLVMVIGLSDTRLCNLPRRLWLEAMMVILGPGRDPGRQLQARIALSKALPNHLTEALRSSFPGRVWEDDDDRDIGVRGWTAWREEKESCLGRDICPSIRQLHPDGPFLPGGRGGDSGGLPHGAENETDQCHCKGPLCA